MAGAFFDPRRWLEPSAPKADPDVLMSGIPEPLPYEHVPTTGEVRGTGPGESRDPSAGSIEDVVGRQLFDASPLALGPMVGEGVRQLGTGVRDGDWGDIGMGGLTLGMAALPGVKLGKSKSHLDRVMRKVKTLDDGQKKILGAPLGVATPQAEAARRKAYKDAVKEGEKGRYWYEDSGKAIKYSMGDDIELSNKFGENFAVTSASTGVPANTAFAVKGHNQAMAGDPINTGRFPKAQSESLESIYFDDKMATGNKRSPFADQLALGGDYYNKPDGVGQGHRAVHDIWDGELWGYVDANGKPIRRAFSPPEHGWMDRNMDLVLEDLGGNWTPRQAQAAGWQAAKVRAGKVKPDDPILDYGTAMEPYTGQMSREAIPGKRVGEMPELLKAPLDERRAYDEAMASIIYDPKTRDRIGMAYGAPQRGTFSGPGVFEGDLNPGRQVRGAFGKTTSPEGVTGMDPSTRKLYEGIDSVYGLGTSQDAIAGNLFMPGGAVKSATALDIPMGGTIGDDAMRRIIELNNKFKAQYGLADDPFAPVPTPGGVRILSMNSKFPEGEFARMGRSIMDDLGVSPKEGQFGTFDGIYEPAGDGFQNYISKIEALEGSRAAKGLPGGFDRVAPDLFAKINDLNKSTGYTLNQSMMDVRQAIADNGLAGLREMQKKGLIPAVMLPVLAPYLEGMDDQSSEGQTP